MRLREEESCRPTARPPVAGCAPGSTSEALEPSEVVSRSLPDRRSSRRPIGPGRVRTSSVLLLVAASAAASAAQNAEKSTWDVRLLSRRRAGCGALIPVTCQPRRNGLLWLLALHVARRRAARTVEHHQQEHTIIITILICEHVHT